MLFTPPPDPRPGLWSFVFLISLINQCLSKRVSSICYKCDKIRLSKHYQSFSSLPANTIFMLFAYLYTVFVYLFNIHINRYILLQHLLYFFRRLFRLNLLFRFNNNLLLVLQSIKVFLPEYRSNWVKFSRCCQLLPNTR